MSQPGSARSCIFYKLIVPSIIHEKKLRIPEKFIRRFGDELSTVARLTVPNGRIWLVGLKKEQTKIWFHNGWQDFIEHYSIRVGYILVFKYEGLSNFKVQVFNLPTSELNYQSRGRNSSEDNNYGKHNHVFEEMEDDDSFENVGSSSLHQTPRDGRVDQLTLAMSYDPPAAQNMFNGTKLENASSWDDEEGWHSSNQHGAMLSRNAQINGTKIPYANDETQRPQKAIRKRKLDSNNQESSDQHGGERDGQFILNNRATASPNMRVATAEERERALNASKAFEPANPFCRVVLRPSYLYRGCIMYLPSCFAGKHLSGVSGFIKLQDPVGKHWSVRYLYKGGGARLGRGWFDFSLGNNLQEGDVCVFELINIYNVVLKVSIFHALADATTQVNQNHQPSHYNIAPKPIRF